MESQFPDDENGVVLRQLAKKGVNLKKVRNVDFAIVVPDGESAELLAAELRRLGHPTAIHRPDEADLKDGSDYWDVVCTHRIKTTHFNITSLEEALAKIALPFGGRNDGWGFMQ